MVSPNRLARMLVVVFLLATYPANAMGGNPKILIVLGAPGEPEYGTIFEACGNRWRDVFGNASVTLLDGTKTIQPSIAAGEENRSNQEDKETDSQNVSHRQQILDWINQQQTELESSSPDKSNEADAANDAIRWLIMIGHGTSDRSGSKFNLAGPDLTAKEMATALKSSPGRWVIINCSSSSGPFVSELSGPNRIIMTATKSGAEQNYSRFADYLSRAITDPKSDLDHDSQVSVLEAFLASSSGVARFYKDEGRLASEQALLDDNGDKRGTPALFFRGLRAVKPPSDGLKLDGDLAKRLIITTLDGSLTLSDEQSTKAREIESAIERLRLQKGEMDGAQYSERLEALLLELAELLLPQ